MLNILQWITSCISTMLFFAVQGVLVFVIFNKKAEPKRIFVFAFVNAVMHDLLLTLLGHYIASISLLIYILTMLLTLKFVLKLKILQSVCAASILIVISTLLNYIVVAVLQICVSMNIDYTVWEKSFSNMLIGENLGNALLLLVLLLVYYFKMKIIIPEDMNKRRVFSIVLNTLIACVIVIPNMLFFENNMSNIPLELIIFNAFSILILFLLSVYNSIKSGELETKKTEIEFQNLYIKTLNDVIDGMRGFKHDYNNTVQVIGGYLSLNNIDGLKKYYRQMQADLRKINNILPLSSFVKNDPAIYGLLLAKISYAELKELQFVINITTEINTGNITVYNFCKVLGVLIDNALEAAEESERRFIELCINKIGINGIVIEIKNTYQGDIDTEAIFDNGYTTKENHSGFGLWQVKKILSKYKSCSIKTSIANGLFSQRLVILHNPEYV